MGGCAARAVRGTGRRRRRIAPLRTLASVVASRDGADGVGDHAAGLAAALADHAIAAPLLRVPWHEVGGVAGLRLIDASLRSARPDRVILHYSHLAWSERGWPLGLLAALAVCRRHAPVLLWVHDPDRSGTSGWRDAAHSAAKAAGLQAGARLAKHTVVAIERERVYWATARRRSRLTMIPSTGPVGRADPRPPDDKFTVSAFGLNVGSGAGEAGPLLDIGRELVAALGTDQVRVRLLGAGDTPAARALADALHAAGVDVDRPGYLEPDELGGRLVASHAFVMVRAGLSTRNSSTASALACGLPVVGYEGPETGAPLRDAAVIVPRAAGAPVPVPALVQALLEIAHDPYRRAELSSSSHRVYDQHYAWDVVAEQVAALLR